MLVSRLFGGIGAWSTPSSRIVPSFGVSKPASIRIRVVLPQPEGPSSAKNSRRKMSSVRLSIATNSPNFFVTFWKRISGFWSGSSQGAKTGRLAGCAMMFPRHVKRPAPWGAGRRVCPVSGAGLDLGPEPRHVAVDLRIPGRGCVEVRRRLRVRIDRGVADHVLVQELLRRLVAVRVVDVV